MSLFKKILILAPFLLVAGVILFFKPENKNQETTGETSQPKVEAEKIEKFLVTKVVDGDTIVLESGKTVRYIGIDAPETSRGQECFSGESTNKNKELVAGKYVTLEKDISETDRFGRLLRYIYIDNIFVNDYLVRQGYAKASTYPPDVKYSEQFKEAENEAREDSRGLWVGCNSETHGLETDEPSSAKVSSGQGDKDCGDFKTHLEAQEFFISQGGPTNDSHKLDRDSDGLACETLP